VEYSGKDLSGVMREPLNWMVKRLGHSMPVCSYTTSASVGFRSRSCADSLSKSKASVSWKQRHW